MSATQQANPSAQIENIARNLPPNVQDDFRNWANLVVMGNLTALSPGGNLIQAGGTAVGASAAPVGVTFTAGGANGVITIAVTDPSTAKPNTIWHEISYGPLVSFTSNVTTLPPTTATAITIPASGLSVFVRMRVSFDRVNWSAYQLASRTAVDAGLVESGAMSPAAAFNQTNYGVVNSTAAGASAAVTVSGTGGDLTSYPAIRGAAQITRPSATIVGVEPGSEQFVAWNGTTFELKPTLAGVFADGLEPVGKVSVVGTAAPTPPTIVPIEVSGAILGFDVTNGGAGASQPYNLAFATTGGGVGASFGPQTIQNGVLISVGPGNGGHGYSPATTVVATGGTGGGTSGGGTAAGGNGGRLTAV